MKVGIITFHFVENYGAVLQAYALQTVLSELGYDVEILDYRPEYLVKKYRIFDEYFCETFLEKKWSLFLKLLFTYVYTLPSKVRKKRRFQKYIRDFLRLSKSQFSTFADVEKHNCYDICVCGSDQIWNSDIAEGLDPVYFAYFASDVCKKISYAASIGKSEITQADRDKMKVYLDDFEIVTVREEKAKEILKFLEKEIFVVSDPVFLLSRREWERVIEKRYAHGRYVLIYTLEENKLIEEYSKRIAEESGIEIKRISLYKSLKRKNGEEYCGIDPNEFLGLIYNAEFIVTNSFHATAFSIIFQKNFYVVSHSTRGSRTNDLLKKFFLEDRILTNNEKVIQTINYKELNVDEIIDNERKYSISILRNL